MAYARETREIHKKISSINFCSRSLKGVDRTVLCLVSVPEIIKRRYRKFVELNLL